MMITEHELHSGIGEALKYYGIFNRYKPLIDQAKAEYDASPELQKWVKDEFERLQVLSREKLKDSPAMMQLLETMPNIISEIKAVND